MLFKIGRISHEKGKTISAPANTVRIADAAPDLEVWVARNLLQKKLRFLRIRLYGRTLISISTTPWKGHLKRNSRVNVYSLSKTKSRIYGC